MIVLICVSFGQVVLGHKKKYDILSFLLGAEALDVQNQADCMPELKAWVTGTLATMFSNLDSLTSEDGDVIARIATSDTSGTLLNSVAESYLTLNAKCKARTQQRQVSL